MVKYGCLEVEKKENFGNQENISKNNYVKAKYKEEEVNNGIAIGRSMGETLSLNNSIISSTGRVYLTRR